jgi:hypothetical protein
MKDTKANQMATLRNRTKQKQKNEQQKTTTKKAE